MDEVYRLVVDIPGERLDKFVSRKLMQFSRARLQKLIGEGYVLVNGIASKSSLKLNAGDKLTVTIPPPPPSSLSPEDIPLKIIYEDDDLLAIDKPAGLTVHPAPGHPSHTLVNAILSHFPHLADMGDSLRPGIVHRLDKDTSGVMLVAKNATAQAKLQEQFKSRAVEKTYLALVKGHLAPERGMIEAPIGRHPSNRKKMAVVSRGREARTMYQVVRYIGNYTLLEVKPETGRTHQIRVHLAAIGYPVMGDALYGVKSPLLSRQFLHAHRLKIKLPSSGEFKEFMSPLAEDLERVLGEMG
jgi:23S rRNA pseudouridine1911/1915/1917 synthase